MKLLLLQMMLVLLMSFVCGWVARKLGQARVVGEIIGGILLGPSVFGRLAPAAWEAVFPVRSLGALEVLSTVGLVLFLFLIGVEIDSDNLRRHSGTAAVTSAMSILLPFALAMLLAPPLRNRFGLEGVSQSAFTLFLGISLSITAFPVLARILKDRGLQSSSLGTMALICSAIDDVCAWLLLAVAMTLVPHGNESVRVWHRLIWLGIYLGIMLGVVRPLGRWLAKRRGEGALSHEVFAMFAVVLLGSAAATDAIGVHPLFGAFVAGLCFPRVKQWEDAIHSRIEMVVSVFLLPLFFALTGLRTRLDLFSGVRVWMWAAAVLAIAVAGKMGGALVAARWAGESWRNAWALGALLNTRGLVELVVLNIAFSAGVFSATLFTMMVVMALATTMMTTPLLNCFGVPNREYAEKFAAFSESRLSPRR